MPLHRGKLSAWSSPSPQRFAVRTPHVKFIDLGTTFGVQVDQGGKSSSSVFSGEVVCSPYAPSESSRLLYEGKAPSVDGHTVENIDSDGLPYSQTSADWEGPHIHITAEEMGAHAPKPELRHPMGRGKQHPARRAIGLAGLAALCAPCVVAGTLIQRALDKPVIPIDPNHAWRAVHVANAAILTPEESPDGRWRMYLRGSGFFPAEGGQPEEHYHDSIGLLTQEAGTWDEGGIWCGEVFEYQGTLHMYYEGWGTGRPGHDRDTPYAPGGRSQTGLASVPVARFLERCGHR